VMKPPTSGRFPVLRQLRQWQRPRLRILLLCFQLTRLDPGPNMPLNGGPLSYEAPTAHGGSGGPVFNTKGEVIGVNSAFMDGFTGGTIGVSVDSPRPLLQEAEKTAQK
jgi:hypothetical protein